MERYDPLDGGRKFFWWRLPDGTISKGEIDIASLPLYRLQRVLTRTTADLVVITDS